MYCNSCKFFEDATHFWDGLDDESRLSGDTSEFGFCHRHAPLPARGLTVKEIQWPMVHETDWCGEYVETTEEATDGPHP